MAKRQRQRVTQRRHSAPKDRPADAPDVTIPDVAAPKPSKATKSVDHSHAARAAAGRRTQQRRQNIRLAAILAVIAIPVVAIILVNGVLQPQIGIDASSEGGVGVHVAQDSPLTHRNRPPSSGPHYPGPSAYRVTADPVPPGNWIHNLEHGAIVVLYRCADRDACAEVTARLQQEVVNVAAPGRFGQVKIVGTPYLDMDAPITAVAWGKTLPLETFDAAQILAFYDRYVDRGPENAP